MVAIKFIGRNWKWLLALFCIGGTATVVGVVPGLEGLEGAAKGQIETVKGKLVSEITVQ